MNFKYILGANIELFIEARFIPEDTETGTKSDIEILQVKDSDGLDVETGEIFIKEERLDDLLWVAAMEERNNPSSKNTKTSTKTPSQQAKAAGLKSLLQVSELTGVSMQTLDNWAKNKSDLFRVLLAGCVAELNQR